MRHLIIFLAFLLLSSCNFPTNPICCGGILPSAGDFNTEVFAVASPSSTTFEYELIMHLDHNLICTIETIEVRVDNGNGGPSITNEEPLILHHTGCNNLDGKIFSCKFIQFVSSPVGFDYDLELIFRDANGGTVANYNAAYVLSM